MEEGQKHQNNPTEIEKEQQHQQQEPKDKQKQERQEQEQNNLVLVSSPTPAPLQDPKPQSPSSDSPLSSDDSSLCSHTSSVPPSQPSNPNPPPPEAAADVKAEGRAPNWRATGHVEEQKVGTGSGRRLRPDLSILKRARRESMLRRALLGFRACGFACCLVSFSVLAADKNQGWTLDSFYRYKEFRYCMAVNVIGFAYSGFQAYGLIAGKKNNRHRFRCLLNFSLDQILSYLLLSASSSAAVRIDDWQSNWGPDKFPEMASASVGLSFVAFIAFALSSILSGYMLCTLKST